MVEYCAFRTTVGDVGILGGHSPYVAAIDTGEIRLRTESGETRYAAAAEGFAHMTGDHLRILVSECAWAEEIDAVAAKEAKEAARARYQEAKTPEEKELTHFQLQKARVWRRVAKKIPEL